MQPRWNRLGDKKMHIQRFFMCRINGSGKKNLGIVKESKISIITKKMYFYLLKYFFVSDNLYFFYPALVQFEQSNCIDWINFCFIYK